MPREPLADRNGKKPTAKQVQARQRNWHLKQLRAFFHLIPPAVPYDTKVQLRYIIDCEITRLGGESEIKRQDLKFHYTLEQLNRNDQPRY
jgi:hypothetical protein